MSRALQLLHSLYFFVLFTVHVFALAPAFRLADWRKILIHICSFPSLDYFCICLCHTATFCLSPTPNNCFLLLSTSNNNRLLTFHNTFSLMSNSSFSLTTLLTNYVSRNQFVNYCVYVFFNNLYHPFHLLFQQLFTFLQSIPPTNHFVPRFNHFHQPFLFFPCNRCQQATIQLIFSATSL